jgi:hypothetical protein
MFKYSVFNEPVISQCVSEAIFYSRGSVGGIITGVIVVEGKVGKVRLTLEQATKAQKRSRGIALLFL